MDERGLNENVGQAAIEAGARALEAGQLVAFPTETVYGLGADAENPAAVAAIYAAKGRPQDHPVIVHLAPEADIAHWACDIPPEAHALAEAFWPGPLTMILKRAPNIPDAVSGGQDTVGLRCPSHPVAIALLRAFKGGQLVAFPTETVYGLGADAENPAAVAAIYAAKGRPPDHVGALPVHRAQG
ncbi:threonylcarbamoyl-AMP synthase, partial [Massilia sp. IC2-278]|uniref:L-threonylcarbamoyladenylate synthase n=1 Tax=Massilia sp. IC2-278 TaxID=2887200 RepID=UPI001E37F600